MLSADREGLAKGLSSVWGKSMGGKLGEDGLGCLFGKPGKALLRSRKGERER